MTRDHHLAQLHHRHDEAERSLWLATGFRPNRPAFVQRYRRRQAAKRDLVLALAARNLAILPTEGGGWALIERSLLS